MAAQLAVRPLVRRDLRQGQLLAARGAVLAFAGVAAIFLVRWVVSWVTVRVNQADQFTDPLSTGPVHAAAYVSIALAIAAIAIWWALAGLVFARRSRDLYGLYLSLAFLCFGVCLTDPSRFTPLARSDSWGFTAPILLLANSLTLPWVFLFPDGRPVPRWAWALIAFWVGWYVVRMITPAADPRGTLDLLWILVPLWALGSIIFRYIRLATDVQRAQLKWIALAGIFFIVPWAIINLTPDFLPAVTRGTTGFYYTTAAASLYALAQVALPLTIATAIFREGLLDIDLLLNRAFVYTALTSILVASFVLISTVANSVATAVTGKTAGLVPLVTAFGLAILFVPMRTALLRFADRFMSGRRVLIVVFLDIVQSTEHAVRLGDRAWRALVENFQSAVRKELKRFGGDEIDTAGDGFLVTFPGPGRAIQFGREVVRVVRTLELQARAGIHVGEVEVHGSRVFGVAVHIAARLVALAEPDEVLVSSDLKELIAGSNYDLVDRGEHQLKGVPGSAHVYAVA